MAPPAVDSPITSFPFSPPLPLRSASPRENLLAVTLPSRRFSYPRFQPSPTMPHHEERFSAPDGLSLYGQCWLPDAPALAAVVVVHGFVEHSGRYAQLAEGLNRHGYSVHAFDLRGHGRSDGPRCFIRTFEQYLADLDLFLQRVRAARAGQTAVPVRPQHGRDDRRPVGHHPTVGLRGLVLSGPASRVGRGLFPLLRHLARLLSLLAPRMPVVRLGSWRICATRRSLTIFDAIRWSTTTVSRCGPGRRSWPRCG